MRKELSPSRAVSAKIDEYKTMMHENTHSHFSKVSVNTPLTKNVRKSVTKDAIDPTVEASQEK